MTAENKYTLDDLVNFSSTSKPLDFENAFDHILKDRLADKIELIKKDIAKNIFNKQEEGTNDGEEDQIA